MIFFRRLPGLCYSHVYAVSITLLFSIILICLLVSWGFLCSNLEPWNHVNKICSNYDEKKYVGDMCSKLCSSQGAIHSYSCRAFHAGKEAVFAATLSNSTNNYNIIIKSVVNIKTKDGLSWTNNPYPTEQEFTAMIQQTINARLNISLKLNEAELLSRFPSGNAAPEGTDSRRKEIIQIWNLLEDNEYLLCRVYEPFNIFPRVIGSCGRYYFSEYLEPVLDSKLSQFLGQDGSWIMWESRLNFGLKLLNLIDNLDSLGLLICDVKPGHFGLSSSGDRIKLLDLDVTFPKVIADRIASDGRACLLDEDCAIFDCASKCNENNTCQNAVTSTNLQVICRKVFLGDGGTGGDSGIVSLGGLLLGERTPAFLASMLRQCSHGNLRRTSQLHSAINNVLRSLNSKVKDDSIYLDY